MHLAEMLRRFLPGDVVNFKCAEDLLLIMYMDFRGIRGVYLPELLV